MIDAIIELDKQLLALFNGSDSLFLDGVMAAWTYGFTWVPLYLSLLYLVIKNNETMPQIALVVLGAALCLLLDGGVIELLIKPLVARPRPINDPFIKDTIDTVRGTYENSYSFFSAHAANTFSIALFFSLLMRNKVFTAVMLSWSLMNGYTRLYLGVHYPFDVLTGFLYGGAVGTGVYTFYRYLYAKLAVTKRFFSVQYTPSGYAIADVERVLAVFFLIVLYILFRGLFFF